MTKKILLITQDKALQQFAEITALTLTKLNCQVGLNYCIEEEKALKSGCEDNLDLILLDLDLDTFSPIQYITAIRESDKSKNKKIISFSDNVHNINRDEIFKSCCDSIMSKEELRASLNNIFQY